MNTTETAKYPSDELDEIRGLATSLDGERDLDPLIDRLRDCRYVLLGEASHGTSDYYRWRARISRRLIEEHGFSFVAVEGDWPDCFAVNRWVKGRAAQDRTARQVLGDYERWPTWMWANEEVTEFVDWLRDHNLRSGATVGFYGLDVYSLWESMRQVLHYLDERHPHAIRAAHDAMRCFEPYGEDPQDYAWASRLVPSQCENEVVTLLAQMQRTTIVDERDPEAELDALQNAEVVAGAERYYRTMVQADRASWNVRDGHMIDTLDRLMVHHGRDAKAIVWEHNTHVGDARGSDMAAHGLVTIGQLARDRHGVEAVALVGFGGRRGSVIASSAWGALMRRMAVPTAPEGSHEDVLRAAGASRSLLVFPERRDGPWLSARRGHRAIGVVYDPRRDPHGNWVPTIMGRRYDAFCSFDDTGAVHPLHFEAAQPHGEQETYPWTE